MPLQLGVVKEPLVATRVCAFEELVPMNCHVLLHGGSIGKNFPARLEMAPVDPWLHGGRFASFGLLAVLSETLAEYDTLSAMSL